MPAGHASTHDGVDDARYRRRTPAHATDLPAERPALAALLVQPARRVAAAGAYATMLDLVARGVLLLDTAAGTIRAAQPHPPVAEVTPKLGHVSRAEIVDGQAAKRGRAFQIPMRTSSMTSP
ncbi:hypothetical protein ACFQZ4_51115 [Catellatospora coxensis]